MLRQRGDEPAGAAMDVLITPVTPADVAPVTALARLVWQQTYPGIISGEQIDFMLEQRYNPQRLLEELTMPRCGGIRPGSRVNWSVSRRAC
jgi:hypothetical protein